ncbi:MAG: serine/threonine protein kinase [Candidatus Hydrogenedentes bacterium]|nr:serine/threonine protein kinase [Candidatus Hydrogenedentota bacterium]
MPDYPPPKKLGRYEVVAELGKGAMGVVYEGRDPNIGRRVAIKTARRDVMESTGMADEMMVRFLREAQAAGALNHPNIITIYDADEEDGIAYIAMEFLEGGNLRDLIDAKKKLDVTQIVEIGATLCEALAVAHDNGIVHRDIKPANIMTVKGGEIKIADFGIAHVSDSNLTQEGALIGTPHYMSPEQFMGQKLDGRSDLFSVANILYEMLTGEKPFTGEALSTVMHHVIKTDPTPPHEFNLTIPDELSKVIMKALAKRPAQRYKDGRAMAAALRESLKDNPDPAILEGRIIDAGFTVVGKPPADATVVAGATTATKPGDAPTLVSTGAPDATKTGPAPAGAAATGGTHVSGAPATSAAPATTAAPAAPTVPAAPPVRKLAMIGAGGVFVVLLVAAVALVKGLGGGTSTTPPGTGKSNSGNVSPTLITPENTILFTVYGATSPENYDEWVEAEGGVVDPHDIFNKFADDKKIRAITEGKVQVTDPAGGSPISVDISSTGDATVKFAGDAQQVSASVEAPGFTGEDFEPRRRADGQWEKQYIVLKAGS